MRLLAFVIGISKSASERYFKLSETLLGAN
jgi:hypothetical protein